MSLVISQRRTELSHAVEIDVPMNGTHGGAILASKER